MSNNETKTENPQPLNPNEGGLSSSGQSAPTASSEAGDEVDQEPVGSNSPTQEQEAASNDAKDQKQTS